MEVRVGGTGLDLPPRRRDGQEYGAGGTAGGGKWQDGSSYFQGRQGGGDRHMRSSGTGQGGGSSYSRQLRGNRYDGSYSGKASMVRGAQSDSSARMVSLNRGVRT
ncbi:hypothetical protein MLD38_023922 [Melastoma candidum]|nr:hypothetical protein MLD38_023922 [Melastoma candidum]